MKYSDEEVELLDALETQEPERVAFDNEALKVMAKDTLEYLNEKNKSAST